MNEQTEQIIKELSEKLGTTTEYIFQTLVRQAMVSGITSCILIVLLVTLSIVGFFITKKLIINYKSTINHDHDAVIATWSIYSTVTAFMMTIAFVSVSNAITCFVNPEFWAVQYILNTIR